MRQYLFKAIKEFQEKTSIKFVQKQDFKKHNQYVKYTKSSNGRSFVFKLGRQIQEKEHVVHIEENSDYGTYLHETMHVLGFDHTQCRIDRDLYLSFQQSQLDPEDMNQYQIREMGYMIGEYDFDSTMHYGQSEYMTLKAEYQHKNIGFRQQLSDGDIKGIEFIYGNSQCTYDVSSNNKYEQIYYECITCWGKNSIFGACRICALICHKDHQIIKKSGSFSCHCGKQDHRVQLCTRESAGQQRVQQPMYLCLDCFDIKKYQQNHDGATPGVCHACAIKCHKLHNLQFYGVATDFYCDCGLTASETDCRAK
ncbi:unnamed protein product (macronuclear) [Paramecium tetraurelia]|uniref:Metalloendopeptidase n=1 Tax=Paramecium tetraurelia TaxID=5888 RepID=A0DAT5_PARTE|nr:uncharacterized protein GSPATT00015059001 [Paramecium tetraurelia]CAK80152.1 unnamed protein product [Paramecium tetraurelia]|eukprot:XP_001447549.1 hypothetical protein (macronuclear) [Paramecium tetraurelia strain d4-2]